MTLHFGVFVGLVFSLITGVTLQLESTTKSLSTTVTADFDTLKHSSTATPADVTCSRNTTLLHHRPANYSDESLIDEIKNQTLDSCIQECCSSIKCDSVISINTTCFLMDCFRSVKDLCSFHELSSEHSSQYAFVIVTHVSSGSTSTVGPSEVSTTDGDPKFVKNETKYITVGLGGNRVVKYPANSVKFTGTVIPDDDGSREYEYSWSIMASPEGSRATLDHSAAVGTLTNLDPGIYTIKLKVTDKAGITGSSVVNVTVEKEKRKNEPPVAKLSPNPTSVTLPNNEVILSAGESTDDTGIVSYTWEEVKRPVSAENLVIDNSDPTNPNLKLSGLTVAGDYQVSLTVADAEGLTDKILGNVTVIPEPDYPPNANAGTDQIITLPVNSVTLHGNLSTDDKGIVSYKWQNTPDPESASLSADTVGSKTDTLVLSNLEKGRYTFTLEVEDTIGQKDTAVVHVIVEEPRDKPPVAVVPATLDLHLPDSSIELDGSGSSDDNGVATYNWTCVSQPDGSQGVVLEDANKPVARATHLSKGEYEFKLKVTDRAGQSSSAKAVVTVHRDTNSPPVADAGPDRTLNWPVHLLELSGAASHDDGGIVRFKWKREESSRAGGDIVNGTDSKEVLKLINLVPGVYSFTLTVWDVQGVSGECTVKVRVVLPESANHLLELRIAAIYSLLTQDKVTEMTRSIAVDLAVEDEEVIVEHVGEMRSSGFSFILFRVVDQQLGVIRRGVDMKGILQEKLKNQPDRFKYPVLMLDTYICQNSCSNHGKCNSYTKECECDGFWMENSLGRKVFGGEPNCDWSVLYVVIAASIVLVVVAVITYLALFYTRLCAGSSKVHPESGGPSRRRGLARRKRTPAASKRTKRLNNNEYVELIPPPRQDGKNSDNTDTSDELFTAVRTDSRLQNGFSNHVTSGNGLL